MPTKLKEREGNYLSRKKVLNKFENERYEAARVSIERRNKLQKLKEYEQEAAYKVRREKYGKSFGGKLGTKVSKGFSAIRNFNRPSGVRQMYQQQGQLPPNFMMARDMKQTIAGSKTNRRGRPSGTLDKRYAAYGGVYGFRKYQAAQLRIARLNAMRQATISPEQQAYLRQLEARQQAQSMNPERRVIPSTQGTIPLKGIMDEIDQASHIFD